MKPIFFFGTLRDEVLLSVVIGRPLDPGEAPLARAVGWQAWRVAGEAYPMLRAVEGAVAEGRLFRPASAVEHEAILFYEEAEYGLTTIAVETEHGPAEAVFFDATDHIAEGEGPWCFDTWTRMDRRIALEAAAELMPLRATLPMERINDVWPGIMNRARQRARAAAEVPVLGGIRTPFDAARDVEWLKHERPYTGYLAVEHHQMRHRRFDGTMSAPVNRVTVAWGDAVTVLPYDPVGDRVLLIEQFRPAPASRLDPNPWCIEVPAGRIDADEPPENAVRREAEEEAGIRLGRLLRLPGYYASPGLAAEHLGAWIGEADLSGVEGGVFGAETEGEDIRTMVLGFEDMLSALQAGAVNTGPAQLLLLWLALERPRLRAEWAGL